MGSVTRSALTLAALADAAVPGLLPISVSQAAPSIGDRFTVAFVVDNRDRHWVVRVPRDKVAAARQDGSFALLELLAPRIPFSVPRPAGSTALADGRRAHVYPLIDGVGIDLSALPPGPGLAAELGRALAAVHNVDRRLYDEAGAPSYDSDTVRRRHLALLDRAAGTRRVPAGLLTRWERMLDDVALWRFAPTPLHGRIDGDHVLASFPDDEDASAGTICGLVGWESAGIGDPAEDFVEIARLAPPEAADTVLEAYAMARVEEPDLRILQRATLVAELRVLADFLAALADGDRRAIATAGEALQHLDAEVGDEDAPARADEEPLFDTVPLDFTPRPVGAAIYTAGSVEGEDVGPAVEIGDHDAPTTLYTTGQSSGARDSLADDDGDRDEFVDREGHSDPEGEVERNVEGEREGEGEPEGHVEPEGDAAPAVVSRETATDSGSSDDGPSASPDSTPAR